MDAVGAGDAFVAGYPSALLDGEWATGRLVRAVTTGAFAVAWPGDWEGAPIRAEPHLLGTPPGTVVRCPGPLPLHDPPPLPRSRANLSPCLVTNTAAAPAARPSS
ncbi:hypothetical protein [Streptomyces monomycini]|uniref:hypothetical protein n=1 Tax=Streptomyces monomycini TaxID=371720 RepID=UPI000D13C032